MRAPLAGFALVLTAALTAQAQEAEPDEAVKYRQNTMKSIGGAAGRIGAVMQEKVPHQDNLAGLAALLAAATDPALTVPAFQQNTDGQGFEKTTATAKIWEDWDDFESRLRKLGEVTKAAADAGDGVSMDQMKPVFETCKGCHDTYREKS